MLVFSTPFLSVQTLWQRWQHGFTMYTTIFLSQMITQNKKNKKRRKESDPYSSVQLLGYVYLAKDYGV